MSVLFLLIAASLTLASAFLVAFIWAVKSGQFDDHYSPAVKILFDPNNKNHQVSNHGENKCR
ncbi:MAG: cbb3-type cytochrome oxidase assembly protein CcoS [Candidatus Marinimicrobia bacterium]|nr:cbb3-type cytochrome oxidase assembly protein CcoS [Candidatus Neomarinimicrobiota bacterium]